MALSELYTLPIRIGGVGPVHVIGGSATASTDNTIYTPASGFCAFLVGAILSETDAVNVTYKSGSTTIVTTEQAANQGVWDKISEGVTLGAAAGQALKVNPSADVSSAVFFVVEAKNLVFE